MTPRANSIQSVFNRESYSVIKGRLKCGDDDDEWKSLVYHFPLLYVHVHLQHALVNNGVKSVYCDENDDDDDGNSDIYLWDREIGKFCLVTAEKGRQFLS